MKLYISNSVSLIDQNVAGLFRPFYVISIQSKSFFPLNHQACLHYNVFLSGFLPIEIFSSSFVHHGGQKESISTVLHII